MTAVCAARKSPKRAPNSMPRRRTTAAPSSSAFQQVEDSLATLNHYHDASVEEKAAVAAAQRTLDFSMALYKQGATDYLTVVTSQTALLQTQLEALNLDTLQLTASVDLIRALGGGWEDSASRGRRAKAHTQDDLPNITLWRPR